MIRIEQSPLGDLTLGGLPAVVVDTLHRIPELLTSEDEAIRGRLEPRTYEEDDEDAQWQRLVGPELRHLFASRAEIVREDLVSLRPDDELGEGYRFDLPAPHRAAWLAALNGASHALYALHRLTPADVERDIGSLGDPERDLALLRIRLLGMLQAALLEMEGYGFPEFDPGDEDLDDEDLDDEEPEGGDPEGPAGEDADER